jgi:hypothetical protein
MPRLLNRLTDRAINSAKINPSRHADGGGLFLVVRSPGCEGRGRVTLTESPARLRRKPVNDIGNEVVLSVLKPIWTEKPETAARLRGRLSASWMRPGRPAIGQARTLPCGDGALISYFPNARSSAAAIMPPRPSEPVERGGESLDYVPTQIRAEIFKSLERHGVCHKSGYGEDGFNVALFAFVICAAKRRSFAECHAARATAAANSTGRGTNRRLAWCRA